VSNVAMAVCSASETPETVARAQRLHPGRFQKETTEAVRRLLCVVKCRGASEDDGPVACASDRLPGMDTELLLEALVELDSLCIDGAVLAATQIGKEVNALTTHPGMHPDAEVVEKAKELVCRWKKDLQTRRIVVKGFEEKGGLQKRTAMELEEGLAAAWCPLGVFEGEASREYNRHYKRLCSHLKSRGPGNLAQRLQDREVSCMMAPSLLDSQLYSAEKLQQEREAREAGLRAAVVDGGDDSRGIVTNEFVCQCGSSHTKYVELHSGWHNDQADTTILVQCLDCNARWKAHDQQGTA